MAEALVHQSSADVMDWTADGTYLQGAVVQLPDGRAGVVKKDCVSGDVVGVQVSGTIKVTKATDLVWIKGGPIYWDHSADAATCNEPIGAGDRDFFLGTATDDAIAAATTGYVNLNVHPYYIIDSARDNFDFNIIKTVVGSTTVEVPNIKQVGGMTVANFGTTAEAQTVSMTSGRSFAIGSNWVCEMLVELVTAADSAAVDVDFGVASAPGTTDFEAVGEFAAFHLDGDDLVIDAHSDDGTTDVAPTTTTVSIAAGTPMLFTLDGRDTSNVKYYINGAEVNAATTNMGKLSAASGPLYANFIAEKTSDDSPLVIRIRSRVRTMQAD